MSGMRRLPSLSGVEAFVAVARTRSLKAAAEELSLSSPALSRRIRSFERHVGRALFERRHQAMALNADGERLLGAIAPPLDALSDAIDALGTDRSFMRLRLGVLPLFATQRLMPLLPRLRAAHPALHLDLDTAPYAAQRLGEGLDAAIILSREPDPALHAQRLDRNQVYAIVARQAGERVAASLDELGAMTVIVHRDMPDTFHEWRRAIGRPELEPAAIDHYDSGQLMLDAAAQGLGVAFMHASHLAGAQDDRLTRLLEQPVESPYSYWFVCRPRALEQPAVRLFHDWLLAEVAEQPA